MKLHGNARLTPYSRLQAVRAMSAGRSSVAAIVAHAGVSERTLYKWQRRFRDEGERGLQDRSSRPGRIARCTSQQRVRRVLKLRCQGLLGRDIASRLHMLVSTVHRYLKRYGVARLSDLEPKPVVVRYEREQPGELVHMDTKKLARIEREGHRIHGDRSLKVKGAGWEYLHCVVDDCTRIAYSEVLPDERKDTVSDFFSRARKYYLSHGITIRSLMTDNGPAYKSKLMRRVLEAHDIRHLFTKPYTPRTNGKVERFIQTATRQWAYGRSYPHSEQRTQALESWEHHYNHQRPHYGLNGATPFQRLARRTEQPAER